MDQTWCRPSNLASETVGTLGSASAYRLAGSAG